VQLIVHALAATVFLWAKDGTIEHVASLKIKPADTVGARWTRSADIGQGLDAGMDSRQAITGPQWPGNWPA